MRQGTRLNFPLIRQTESAEESRMMQVVHGRNCDCGKAFSILYWSNYTAGTTKLMPKSETAVQSDHVLKFVYDKDALFIRGIVQASMRDWSYQVTITLGSNYTVEQSTCECVNGMDKCHHKASILLCG
ncbi:uncharacterized protein LOC134265586 [Saccostrea cucullata]|uniref:uncharacterized protein LOC134265586 n=1 Tax=Saccostrea cuccullata TaxID=36930 RepID=UPI002ED120AE